jgi:hypothetical protein
MPHAVHIGPLLLIDSEGGLAVRAKHIDHHVGRSIAAHRVRHSDIVLSRWQSLRLKGSGLLSARRRRIVPVAGV